MISGASLSVSLWIVFKCSFVWMVPTLCSYRIDVYGYLHPLVESTGIVHLLLGPFSIVHGPSYTIYTTVARYISTVKNNRSNFEQNRATMLNSFYPMWICIVSDVTENPTFVLMEDLGNGLFHWELL